MIPRRRVGLLVAGFMTTMTGSGRAQTDIGFSPYVGALWFDGSCVQWDEGECEGNFANGDPAILVGARLSMLLHDHWGLELAYAASPIESGPGPVGIPQNTSTGTLARIGGVPFNVVAHLYYGGLTYSLRRTERTDIFLSGVAGGVTFDGSASGDPGFTDLLLGLGIGGSVRLDRLIRLRTDLRAFSQPCREEISRDGFRCEDGSTLGHLEFSVGVVLGFPEVPKPGS